MKVIPLILLFLTGISISSFAQKKFTNPELAQQLKEIYNEEAIVATNSSSTYEYVFDESQLRVGHTEDIDLISLKSNIKYRRSVYYNDHVKVKKSNVKYTSGRGTLKSDEVCGNYEVDGIFYSDAKVCSYFFDILYEASEVSFSAVTEYDDPRYFTRVFFHDQDPAVKREIKIIVPDEVEVELVEMNFDGFDIKKQVREEAGRKTYQYNLENLSEFKDEGNSLGITHEYPHLLVLTKSFQVGGNRQIVLSKVDDLYAWYSGLVNEVNVDASALKSEVDRLVEGAGTDEEKIRNIYYWVQENIKYIAFEDGLAGFQPAAPQEVYHNRFGDCKGMAILTKTMLCLAGFDARLTWIGTKSIPYNYDYPSLAVDNHMICTVIHQGKQYILDATEKYIALGDHAERIQGKEMLIEDGAGFIRKKVPVETADKNLIHRNEKLRLEGDRLVGEGELQVLGEAKKMILYYSTNSRIEDKAKLYDFLSVSEFQNTDEVKVSNIPVTDREQPLNIKYTYQLGNKVNGFDQELFIDLDWEKVYKNLMIDEERHSDYYFGRKIKNKVTKTFVIPKNFKVTHLPVAVEEQFKDITIKAKFQQKGQSIIYSNEIVIESGKISKEDFAEWNKLLEKLNGLYEDQIVITKIS